MKFLKFWYRVNKYQVELLFFLKNTYFINENLDNLVFKAEKKIILKALQILKKSDL